MLEAVVEKLKIRKNGKPRVIAMWVGTTEFRRPKLGQYRSPWSRGAAKKKNPNWKGLKEKGFK